MPVTFLAGVYGMNFEVRAAVLLMLGGVKGPSPRLYALPLPLRCACPPAVLGPQRMHSQLAALQQDELPLPCTLPQGGCSLLPPLPSPPSPQVMPELVSTGHPWQAAGPHGSTQGL
jgi:hypothetical protein